MAKLEVGVIIAMKGHPGSGKSTLAKSIASSLRIPLIDKDDIKDCTLPLRLTSPASLLNDLSYDAIWQIASTQLTVGLSVVLDSPLSRRVHFDRLRQLAASYGVCILIIECRPNDRELWRRRLEERGGGGGGHKPATWEDLEKLLEEYDGCTEYDVGDVARMVVDTTAPVSLDRLCCDVLEFIFCHTEFKQVPDIRSMSQRVIEELQMGQQILREEVRQLRTQLDLVMQLLTKKESSQSSYQQQVHLAPQMQPLGVTSPPQQQFPRQQEVPRSSRSKQPRVIDPIPVSYSQMLQRLLPLKLVKLRNMPPLPRERLASYDPNAYCEFHSGGIGHDVEDCLALKHKIQDLIDNKQLAFKGGALLVNGQPLP